MIRRCVERIQGLRIHPSGVLMGVIPVNLLHANGLDGGWRVGQAGTMLDSPWVLVAALGAAILLGALTVFLLWANDVPVPTLDALRRAPALVSPPPAEDHPPVHLPHPSYWPIVLALAITILGVGLITHWLVTLIGVVATIGSIIGWGLEPGE